MVAVVGLGRFYELLREVATLTVNCKNKARLTWYAAK